MTAPTGQELSDTISRTDLLLARRGLLTDLTDSRRWFARRAIHLYIGADVDSTLSGQVAALTAATLATRAGFPVVVRSCNDSVVLAGPQRGRRLSDALAQLGAVPAVTDDPGAALVTIGDGPPSTAALRLQVSWDGWVASVIPNQGRLGERNSCPLAPIAAAALAVSEIFHHHIGHLDAGYRPVVVSLWDPLSTRPETAPGPSVSRLPAAWMLAGLGHLGQANAWCLSHLPYADGQGELWLVDDDTAAPANISTGVLTLPADATLGPLGVARRKTRLVAAAVERAGRPTRIIEQRLPVGYRHHPGSPDVALIGVDNLELRTELSDVGWPLCIDAGLGATPTSFDTISIHAFPGETSSQDVRAWQRPRPAALGGQSAAFEALEAAGVDRCGLVMLGNQAVAAAFVGMLAASLTIAEALRRACGAPGFEALSLSLDTPSPRGAPAHQSVYRGPLTPVDTPSTRSTE